jgi:hypothetical protein
MGKAKDRDIVAEIAAALPETRQRPWWLRLNEEQKQVVAEILAGWRAGKLGKHKNTAGRVIASKLSEFDIRIGYQGVVAWLDNEK